MAGIVLPRCFVVVFFFLLLRKYLRSPRIVDTNFKINSSSKLRDRRLYIDSQSLPARMLRVGW